MYLGGKWVCIRYVFSQNRQVLITSYPDNIKKACSGKSTKARKCFWKTISTKIKQSADLSAVVDPDTGVLKCGIDEIKTETELHLSRVFEGSFDPVPVHAGPDPPPPLVQPVSDHDYAAPASPMLRCYGDSLEADNNPIGFLNRRFTLTSTFSSVRYWE